MSRIIAVLRHEFIQVLPPTIFFFVAFNVIGITNALMLKRYGIDLSSFAAATVGALVVGKVVLVTDKLPLMNRFPEKPLIYNVAWKTVIYMLAAFAVRYLEHFIPLAWGQNDLAAAHHHLMEEIVWPRFWAIQIWLLVLFLIYTALHELSRLMGRERVLQIFFGTQKISDS